jgi:hypothetical protein
MKPMAVIFSKASNVKMAMKKRLARYKLCARGVVSNPGLGEA